MLSIVFIYWILLLDIFIDWIYLSLDIFIIYSCYLLDIIICIFIYVGFLAPRAPRPAVGGELRTSSHFLDFYITFLYNFSSSFLFLLSNDFFFLLLHFNQIHWFSHISSRRAPTPHLAASRLG